jgi:hypothetical protein
VVQFLKLNFIVNQVMHMHKHLQGAPHSQSASNVLTLPSTGGNVDLVSTASTATLTNKTLTSPKINEDVAVTSTATELNLLDGVTATTAELNILDGVTIYCGRVKLIRWMETASATSTTLADADRMVINDNGTMKQVAVTDMTTVTLIHIWQVLPQVKALPRQWQLPFSLTKNRR